MTASVDYSNKSSIISGDLLWCLSEQVRFDMSRSVKTLISRVGIRWIVTFLTYFGG